MKARARLLTSLPSAVTPFGWAVAVLALAAWLGGWQLGWQELMLVAGGCLVALAVGLLCTIGRPSLDVTFELEPRRVQVGEQAIGRVSVRNVGKRRMMPARLEVPVGDGVVRLDIPALPSAGTADEVFVVPGVRRSVVVLGPARTVRGDPLGVMRRETAWSDTRELYVHPRTVRLTGAAAGRLRDLEGRETDDLAPSGLAFHALRDYQPGDDPRHIHWRTTARTGRYIVREFIDVRRSNVGLLLSLATADYASADEFELAVSAVGSIGAAAFDNDQEVVLTAGADLLRTPGPHQLLDRLSGVSTGGGDLTDALRRARKQLGGTSVVVLATGSNVSVPQLRACARSLGSERRVLAVRAAVGGASGIRMSGGVSVLDLAALSDLRRLMRSVLER